MRKSKVRVSAFKSPTSLSGHYAIKLLYVYTSTRPPVIKYIKREIMDSTTHNPQVKIHHKVILKP